MSCPTCAMVGYALRNGGVPEGTRKNLHHKPVASLVSRQGNAVFQREGGESTRYMSILHKEQYMTKMEQEVCEGK